MDSYAYHEVERLYRSDSNFNRSRASTDLNVPRTTLRRWVEKIRMSDDIEAPYIPSELQPVEDLIAERCRKFKQKKLHHDAVQSIPIKIKLDGPIGIAHMGDSHIDSDGCDMPTLVKHVDVISRTDAMFAANVGDLQNNWVGRLARLYGEQSTSAQESWQLVCWLINQLNWLYLVRGNHDCWSGNGDPLDWIKFSDVSHGKFDARLELIFPNNRKATIHARHDFPGRSMYNGAHGPMKHARKFRSDISVCGHTHIDAYQMEPDPSTGRVMHAIRVSSYKVLDKYSDEHGFDNNRISPCCVTIIDPEASESGLVHVIWDVEEAADYLTWKRMRYKG